MEEVQGRHARYLTHHHGREERNLVEGVQERKSRPCSKVVRKTLSETVDMADRSEVDHKKSTKRIRPRTNEQEVSKLNQKQNGICECRKTGNRMCGCNGGSDGDA